MFTVLVSGATGLIGSNFIKRALEESDIKIIALARSEDKVRRIFPESHNGISYLYGDVRTVDLSKIEVDYIIHAANPTSSKAFISNPVEVISVALDGTRHLLDFAKTQDHLKRFVYLSTMEVYGTPSTDERITEEHGTDLDTMAVRTCYPEGKRMCENLCTSYGSEYGIPVNVLRLTQTFGPGVLYNDNRVFAEFARCAIEGKDIVLKTKGETKRSYLYTGDAVEAILTVLEHGISGEAYNVANEDTYCTIYEMAKLVANIVADGKIKVRIEEGENNRGFAPTLHMNLECSKIRALGWKATVGLEDMYRNMIKDMRKLNQGL